MVLKDVFCTACGSQAEAMVARDDIRTPVYCESCGDVTVHESRCTGGCRLKPYVTSYDGRDWSGDVKFLGIEATNEAGAPIEETKGRRAGQRTDQQFRTDFAARVAERRGYLQSETRRKMGRQSLTVDLGARR